MPSPSPLPPSPVAPVKAWFILGREPLLSAAEIFSLISPESVPHHTYAAPLLVIETVVDPESLIARLGGTIKIAHELATELTEEQLLIAMAYEAQNVDGKINFGISVYGPNAAAPEQIENWARAVKDVLKEAGRSVRYIASDEPALSSATVFHNKLATKGREFIITKSDSGTYSVASTRAVQPLEEFSARDFGRPGRDDVSGMLPPKLAMMIINLATHDLKIKLDDYTILDPFCGSGTILTEAIRLGFTNLVGTDISDRSITDTQKNIDWTIDSLHLQSSDLNLQLKTADATSLSELISTRNIDAIATEPYMGPPLRGSESIEHIKKTCNELADLYTTAFAQFAAVMKPAGSVVFVIPRFYSHDKWLTISDKIVPKLRELGFAKERLLPEALSPASYILYHRPGQRVGREIWKFKKLA